MNAERWIVLSALGFIYVSSNEAPDFDNPCGPYSDECETHTLSATQGSSVLLPCNFEAKGSVLWGRTAGPDLVNLTSEGLIKFLDHMYGRVKVFPNQASEGDYSIRIDELQTSDLGCYRCERGQDCRQVQLVAVRGDLSEEAMILIYICSGVAVFILVSAGGYCCIKCILCCSNRTIYNINNTEGAGTEGDRAAPEQTGSGPVDQQQRGGGHDNVVYENDDQDPSSQQRDTSSNYCNPNYLPNPDRTQPTTSTIYPNFNQFEMVESQKPKQGFHRDLLSRLRQASLSQHYYVNQKELSRQQARSTPTENPHGAAGFGKKKKAKKNGELQNPIYFQSRDQDKESDGC